MIQPGGRYFGPPQRRYQTDFSKQTTNPQAERYPEDSRAGNEMEVSWAFSEMVKTLRIANESSDLKQNKESISYPVTDCSCGKDSDTTFVAEQMKKLQWFR